MDISSNQSLEPIASDAEEGVGSAASASKGSNGNGKHPEDDPHLNAIIGGRFKVLSLIGHGGVGGVYRAQHLTLSTDCAVKFLHEEFLDNDRQRRRFEREARTLASLQHPHIVKVLAVGNHGKEPFIAMEFVEGKSLTQRLGESKVLDTAEALDIMKQLCRGLHYAHMEGIIHRDLKPSNVMLVNDQDGQQQVKIVDFGLARIVGGDSNLTRSCDVIGSPLYMSPEQCLQGDLDRRTDIYALGCIMFELFTGKRPHEGRTALDTMQKHMRDQPPSFAAVAPSKSFPAGLERIVIKALSKLPENRYQAVDELAKELESVNLDVAAPRSKKSHIKVLIALGMCLIAGSLIFLVAQKREKQVEAPPAATREQATLRGDEALKNADLMIQSNPDDLKAPISYLRNWLDANASTPRKNLNPVYEKLAEISEKARDYASEEFCLWKLLDYYKSRDSENSEHKIISKLSAVYRHWGKFDQALALSKDLVSRPRLAIEHSETYFDACTEYADCLLEVRDYKQLAEFANQCLKAAATCKVDPTMLKRQAHFYKLLTESYQKLGKPEEAEKTALKRLQFVIKNHTTASSGNLLDAIRAYDETVSLHASKERARQKCSEHIDPQILLEVTEWNVKKELAQKDYDDAVITYYGLYRCMNNNSLSKNKPRITQIRTLIESAAKEAGKKLDF